MGDGLSPKDTLLGTWSEKEPPGRFFSLKLEQGLQLMVILFKPLKKSLYLSYSLAGERSSTLENGAAVKVCEKVPVTPHNNVPPAGTLIAVTRSVTDDRIMTENSLTSQHTGR